MTDTIVGSTPPLLMFVRRKHPKPLLFAPINTTATLNVYFNCISATYVLLSTSFSNNVWSFHGKEKDLAWIEASAAMKMRSALFWDTTAVFPADRISRWITFMSGERGRQCREKSHIPEIYSVSVAIEPEDGDRAGLRNTGPQPYTRKNFRPLIIHFLISA